MIKKTILLIVPSLTFGGTERVMSIIANFLVQDNNLNVYLLLLSKKDKAYQIDKRIKIIEFHTQFNNPVLKLFAIVKFIRDIIIKAKPYSILSFGSMYNSYVMLAALTIKNRPKIFLSDRSNPYRNTYFTFRKGGIERHDGIIHYLLKQILYKKSTGIFVQTKKSFEIESKSLKHPNIIYLPNPIRKVKTNNVKKEKIVLNVGRFIDIKNQETLVHIFSKINMPEWELVLVGGGPNFNKIADYINKNKLINIRLVKETNNVEEFYLKSKIFAFTSISEGFPNALGEALAAGCACISFDCDAGPSDLIIDDFNGFLIPLFDNEMYLKKLKMLMQDDDLMNKFINNSKVVLENFDSEKILSKIKTYLIK